MYVCVCIYIYIYIYIYGERNVCCSIICDIKKLETTHMPADKEIITK